MLVFTWNAGLILDQLWHIFWSSLLVCFMQWMCVMLTDILHVYLQYGPLGFPIKSNATHLGFCTAPVDVLPSVWLTICCHNAVNWLSKHCQSGPTYGDITEPHMETSVFILQTHQCEPVLWLAWITSDNLTIWKGKVFRNQFNSLKSLALMDTIVCLLNKKAWWVCLFVLNCGIVPLSKREQNSWVRLVAHLFPPHNWL